MKRRRFDLQTSPVVFAAGFFIGLFVRFLPLFIILMLFLLAAGGISRCISR